MSLKIAMFRCEVLMANFKLNIMIDISKIHSGPYNNLVVQGFKQPCDKEKGYQKLGHVKFTL